jgi:predicted RNA-binding protein
MDFGGRKISQNRLFKETSSTNETKYWLHKFYKDHLKQLDNSKVLGAEKKHSRAIKPIEANDKIILFTTLNIDKHPLICFIGYTMVEETFEDEKNIYKMYKSSKKLKLKGIKYFINPVVAKDLSKDLTFIKNPKQPSNFLNTEYREINQDDFNKILSRSELSKKYPSEYEELTFTYDEFILDSMRGLYKVIREIETKNQLEIKIFLRLLRKFLAEQGISKDLEELEEFYSKNAWKLNFKHNRSRDPDRSVILFNRIGKKRIFSYISLE